MRLMIPGASRRAIFGYNLKTFSRSATGRRRPVMVAVVAALVWALRRRIVLPGVGHIIKII